MKGANQTKEQAEKEFEEMNEDDYNFQDEVLMGPAIWPKAKERADIAKEMLERLGFSTENIEVLENQNKAQYLAKLDALKEKAMAFEESNKTGKATLAIAIINISNRLDPLSAPHRPLLAGIGVPPAGKKIGDYEDFYELTKEGDVLNINEYAAYIADTRETSVQKAYIAKQMAPKSEGGQELARDKVPFKSRVHCIVMDDFQNTQFFA